MIVKKKCHEKVWLIKNNRSTAVLLIKSFHL